MKTNRKFEKNITLEVLDEIQKVKPDPALKDKILSRLSSESRTTGVIAMYPGLQWAAAILILILNVLVLFYTLQASASEDENITDIDSFAKSYSLSTDNYYELN